MNGWLKSISAHLEGRPAIIVAGLIFCGFVVHLGVGELDKHVYVSVSLLGTALVLAIALLFIALFVKPTPADVAEKILQIGPQLFFATGIQSHTEMVELIRESYNIRNLPPPFGIVRGPVSDEKQYQELTPTERDEIARQDREGVATMLSREADRLLQYAAVVGRLPEKPNQSLQLANPGTEPAGRAELAPAKHAPDKST